LSATDVRPGPGLAIVHAGAFGKKDIRIISLWSVFQALYLGLFFLWSKNLLVPMIAHGLFDLGGMIYFRTFMARLAKAA
jgi:membrane protease YdiL (CAAX protease family)